MEHTVINVDTQENAGQLRSDVSLHYTKDVAGTDERINKCIVEVRGYASPSISSLQHAVPDIAISMFVTGISLLVEISPRSEDSDEFILSLFPAFVWRNATAFPTKFCNC